MKRKLSIDFNGIADQRSRQDYWLEIIPRISIDIGYGIQIGWLFWDVSFYIDEIYDNVDEFMETFTNTDTSNSDNVEIIGG